MNPRTPAVVVSVIILCVWGGLSLIGLPGAFRTVDVGELTSAVRFGAVLGSVTAIAVWFGLAYLQWRTLGRFGVAIGALAVVTVIVQSFLWYLGVTKGRASPDAFAVARFILFTLIAGTGLAIAAFVSYAQRDRHNQPAPAQRP